MKKIILITLALFPVGLTGCVSNPGACSYTFQCNADSPCAAGTMGSGCVSDDEAVNDAASCSTYAEDVATTKKATLLTSSFSADDEC